ncbi:hypothetical protein [Streptomyces sp. NPDC056921]|uniref:hypothetical protein n=1 Tax=Streptomyces sp. NPDC056921 TaxID=3345966 RepID=UPI003630A727
MIVMRARYFAAAVVVLCVGGCGQSPQPPTALPSAQFRQYLSEEETNEGRDAQAKQLADGSASKSDYEGAVARLKQCLAKRGITLVNHGWSPVNHQRMGLWYSNLSLPDDVVAAYGDQCHAAHLASVEERYAQQHPPRMAPPLLRQTTTCLSDSKVTTSGRERSLPDLLKSAGSDRERIVYDCVSQAAEKLYPKTPFVIS